MSLKFQYRRVRVMCVVCKVWGGRGREALELHNMKVNVHYTPSSIHSVSGLVVKSIVAIPLLSVGDISMGPAFDSRLTHTNHILILPQ